MNTARPVDRRDIRWLAKIWRRGLATDVQVTVSECADKIRVLTSASAEPGRWRTSRTPYLREIMDALSVASPIECVVVQKSAQTGGTEVALNLICYVIYHSPGTILFVSPTDSASRRNCRLRIDPMLDTPELAPLVVRQRSRQSGNTGELKSFVGGVLFLVGANSAVGLRSTPAQIVILDEVDAFPGNVSQEGDPVELAIARTQTFGGRRKILLISTPTLAGVSRIEKGFLEGDQRRWHCPCPHCGTLQVLKFQQLRWPTNDRAWTWYQCEHCGEAISAQHKSTMVAKGVWIAGAESDGKTASFHISALMSPFISWTEVAQKHLACGDDPARLQVYFNTVLGETWQDTAAIPLDATRIMARASSWGDTVPDAVAVLTAGIDVQQNRLEVEIVGWGAGEQSWSLEYHSLPGNPSEPEVWGRLDEQLTRKRPHRKLGTIPVSCACVDSGNWSEAVYRYTGQRFHRKIFAIKGSSDPSVAIWPRRPARPKVGRQSALYIVGSTAAKEIVVARLRIDRPGNGFCHFPSDRDLDYFEMLTAEKPIRRFVGGVQKRVWIKSPGERNEALDARIYAMCAVHALKSYGFDLAREADRIAALPNPGDPTSRRPATMAERYRALSMLNDRS